VSTVENGSPKRLQNVFVVAERPAELHAFYESALGLKLKFRDQDRWIQYGVGNTNVSLACKEEAGPATSGLVMVFEVDDSRRRRAHRRRGRTGAGGARHGQPRCGAVAAHDPKATWCSCSSAPRHRAMRLAPELQASIARRSASAWFAMPRHRPLRRGGCAAWEDATDCHGAGTAAPQASSAGPAKAAPGRTAVHQVNNIAIDLHGRSLRQLVPRPVRRRQELETFLRPYVDRFERRQGEWRIAARTVVYDWIEERTRPELAREDAALFGVRRPTGAARCRVRAAAGGAGGPRS
jgi:hypothetical protein